jgi:outer membrane biosynthesis protein TonB
MSPLRKTIAEALSVFVMLFLTAFGLAWPALHVLPLGQELGYTVLVVAACALGWVLYGLATARWMHRMATVLIILASIWVVWWAMPAIYAVLRALMSEHTSPALFLYADKLIVLGVFLLMLACGPIVLGDPAFSAPLYLSMLLILWFLGARQYLTAYVPAAVALPMLFVFARSREAGREQTGGGTGRRALPVVAVLAAIAMLLTPAYRTTVPALEKQADRLRQWIEDYFFFTDSRNMFSLRSQGWQPMGDKGLGGTPHVSPAAVMSVTTDRTVYLRGTIYNHYTGRSWRDTISSDRYAYASIRFANLRDVLLDAGLPQNNRAQEASVGVHMLADAPSTLFTPQRVRSLYMKEGLVAYFNGASELFTTRDVRPGDAWSVDYEPYVSGRAATDALARELRGVYDERYQDMISQYTQLPGHLQPNGSTAQLAREVIQNITDPYSRAQALEQHLRRAYRYSLKVKDPPEDVDFAAHFLFETKEGYCTYFATAMTVLARSAGLPARYVEGFLVHPDATGTTVVTGEQAHAWTEIYFAGLGWVTFDATASQQEDEPGPDENSPDEGQPSPEPTQAPTPTPSPEEDEPDSPTETPTPPPSEQTPTPVPDEQPTPESAPDNEPPEEPSRPPSFPWWLLLLALAALMVWRARASAPERRARTMDNTAQLLMYWQAAAQALALLGHAQQDSETLLDYAQRALPKQAQGTARAVSAVIYGRAQALPEQAQGARMLYQGVYQQLSTLQRVYLVAQRTARDILGLPGLAWRKLRRRLRRNHR